MPVLLAPLTAPRRRPWLTPLPDGGADMIPAPGLDLWADGLPLGFDAINLGGGRIVEPAGGGFRLFSPGPDFAGVQTEAQIAPGGSAAVTVIVAAVAGGTLRVDLSDGTNSNLLGAPGLYSFTISNAGASPRTIRAVRHVADTDVTVSWFRARKNA